MGLDWLLDKRKPNPDSDAEFKKIMLQLKKLEQKAKSAEEYKQKSDELEEQLEKISVSAFDELQCPRVGIDKEASEWFKTNVYERYQQDVEVARERLSAAIRRGKEDDPYLERDREMIAEWGRPFEELLKEHHGQYVAELAKNKEGMASVTGVMTSSLDFRGKVIGSSEILSRKICDEAYQDHPPIKMISYAERIEKEINEYVSNNPDWEDIEDAKWSVEHGRNAVKWLRFWGERGFGFRVWF